MCSSDIIHHSGVAVHGAEWTFAQGGVFSHAPAAPPGGAAPGEEPPPLRETLDLGVTELSSAQVARPLTQTLLLRRAEQSPQTHTIELDRRPRD